MPSGCPHQGRKAIRSGRGVADFIVVATYAGGQLELYIVDGKKTVITRPPTMDLTRRFVYSDVPIRRRGSFWRPAIRGDRRLEAGLSGYRLRIALLPEMTGGCNGPWISR